MKGSIINFLLSLVCVDTLITRHLVLIDKYVKILHLIHFQIGGEELERAHVCPNTESDLQANKTEATFRLGTEPVLVELCVFPVLLDTL